MSIRRDALKCFVGVSVVLFYIAQTLMKVKGPSVLHDETDKLINISTNTRPYPAAHSIITLVTAYYPLEKSKFSAQTYTRWMRNFLGRVQTNIVVFTDPSFVKQLVPMRRAVGRVHYSTVPLIDVPVIRENWSALQQQHSIDPEKRIHNAHLYAVWNAKSWFLNETATSNPFASEYFFWVDIGCFRESGHRFRNWPDERVVRTAFEKLGGNDKLLLGLVNPFPARAFAAAHPLTYVGDHVIGGFFGGNSRAIAWWTREYYARFAQCLHHSVFAGKDQSIMNGIALDHRQRIMILIQSRVGSHDEWFYFQVILASQAEYPADISVAQTSRIRLLADVKTNVMV